MKNGCRCVSESKTCHSCYNTVLSNLKLFFFLFLLFVKVNKNPLCAGSTLTCFNVVVNCRSNEAQCNEYPASESLMSHSVYHSKIQSMRKKEMPAKLRRTRIEAQI